MEKLTPQNEHQEHLVQVLLAKMQGVQVEEYNDDNYFWHPSDSNCIFLNTEYRIAPQSTPLPISREVWAMIAPEWKWVAMDKDGAVYFYVYKPYADKHDGCWNDDFSNEYCRSVLFFNIDGINWSLSLTERPEGV